MTFYVSLAVYYLGLANFRTIIRIKSFVWNMYGTQYISWLTASARIIGECLPLNSHQPNSSKLYALEFSSNITIHLDGVSNIDR